MKRYIVFSVDRHLRRHEGSFRWQWTAHLCAYWRMDRGHEQIYVHDTVTNYTTCY